MLLVKLASFSGVKDEERLLAAAVPLDGGAPLDDRTAESLLDAARKSGGDWSSIAVDVDVEAAHVALDRCEELVGVRYGVLRDTKKRENRDRADLLAQLLDDHIRKKREGFEKRIQGHEFYAGLYGNSPDGKRRKGLANAERKKLEDFLARMETRRAALARKSESFSAETREICTLVLEVVQGGG